MKNRHKSICTLFTIIFAMTNCQAEMIVDNDSKVKIHVIEDFASVEETVNSHAGLESFSALEPMFDYIQVLEDDFLVAPIPSSAPEQKKAVYPRVKKMADGRYIYNVLSGWTGCIQNIIFYQFRS